MHGIQDNLPTIHPEFAEKLLTTINSIPANPPHLLFHQFWKYIPDSVKKAYVGFFTETEDGRTWLAEKWFPREYTVEELKSLPRGTLGRELYQHLVDNNLTIELALGYRSQQEKMLASGLLDNMPEDFRYSLLRGFQVHDIEHIVTGLTTTPMGEIALQAFDLAQRNFLYQAIWISTVTARMAYIDPRTINPLMNAITLGWDLGKKNPTLLFIKWEDYFDQPIEQVRKRFNIVHVEPTHPAINGNPKLAA